MHEENGFLAAIRLTPADDVTRLVYADWLDEQDDASCQLKASFIRIELRMANEPEVDYSALVAHLKQLAFCIHPDWLALISRPKIEGCRMWLDHECPGIWSRLTPTHDPRIRTCGACQKSVCYAETTTQAQLHLRQGDYVAVAPTVPRQPDDITTGRLYLGMVNQSLEVLIERPRLTYGLEERELERLRAEATRDTVLAGGDQPPESGRKPPRTRRKSRQRNRNIQRHNWEEQELEWPN